MIRRKDLSFAILAALLGALLVVPTIQLTGCTTTQKTVAYNTLDAVAHTVDAALMAFNDARVQGKVDDATYMKATELKAKYESAFVVAFTTAHANLTAPAPQDLATIAASLVELTKGRTR